MSDFFFAIRMFAFAVVLIVLMQIKIGDATVEQHSLEWIQTSSLVGGLRGVSDGAIKSTSQAVRWLTSSVDATVNRAFRKDSAPGRRSLGVTWDRSPAYKKFEEEKRRKDEAADEAEDQGSPARAATEDGGQ